MADGTVKWLLIGAGAIAGKRVASALAGVESSELVGVCDVVEKQAREVAGQYGAKEIFTQTEKALAETSADAVYVATPVFLHVPFAIAALDAGKHVLVEKPLGIDAEDAGRLVKSAASRDLRAGCSYYRRFFPCYEQARGMLDAGEFGEIVLIRMTYFTWTALPADNWRVVKAKSGGGPLSDMGSHMFDVLIGLLGMPATVFANVHTHVQSYEVEDSAAAVMQMPNGADVLVSFHWNSKTWTHEFEIVGTEAKVKWHPYDSGKVLKTVGRDIQELDIPNAENVHAPLVEDFVKAVLDHRPPRVSLEEAMKTNVLLDALFESARTGRAINL